MRSEHRQALNSRWTEVLSIFKELTRLLLMLSVNHCFRVFSLLSELVRDMAEKPSVVLILVILL